MTASGKRNIEKLAELRNEIFHAGGEEGLLELYQDALSCYSKVLNLLKEHGVDSEFYIASKRDSELALIKLVKNL